MEQGHNQAGDTRPLDLSVYDAVRRYPGVLRKHRRLFLRAFILFAIVALASAYLKKPVYESSAQVVVKLDQRDILSSSAEVRYDLAAKMAEEAVTTQAELLRSPENIAQVVKRLGPDVLDGPPSTSWIGRAIGGTLHWIGETIGGALSAVGLITRASKYDETVETIAKNLMVAPVRRSHLIDISFRARTPQAAQAVLEELVNTHIAKLVEMDAYAGAYEFYRKQTQDLLAALEQSEAALGSFKKRYAIVDLDAEKGMLIQKVERLASVLEGVPSQGEAYAPKVSAKGTDAKNADSGVGMSGGELAQLAGRLNELRLERARRASLYENGAPVVEEVDNQIAKAEAILRRESANLRALIARHRERLNTLDAIEPQLRQLQRDVAAKEENYHAYVRAAESRRILQDQKGRVQVQAVATPPLPDRPAPPSRLRVLLMGLVIALVLSAGLVVLAEWHERLSKAGNDTPPKPEPAA